MQQHKIKMLVVGVAVSALFLGYFVYTLFDYDGLLNVNEATAAQLCALPGVDQAAARRLVQQRPFRSVEQFMQAAGFDAKTRKKLRRHLTLHGATNFDRVIRKMGPTFKQARWEWLVAAALIHLFSFALRAWRWQVLLKPVKRVGFWSSFNPVMIGFMCNTVLPLRVGEFARPAVFAAKEGVSFSASLATVVLERVFDMLGVVVALAIAVTFVPEPKPAPAPTAVVAQAPAAQAAPAASKAAAAALAQVKKWGKILGPAAIAAVVVFFALGARPRYAERVLKKCTAFLPHAIQNKLIEFFDKFIVGLQSLEDKKDMGRLIVWTGVVWFDIILVYWTTAFAFDIPLTLIGATLCFVLAAAAVAAPQAPGFIGPFQVAVQFGLTMLQVEATKAASYAIMLWVVSMVPIVIVGFICMALGGVSFADVQRGDAAAEGIEPRAGESAAAEE